MRIAAVILLGLSCGLVATASNAQAQDEIARLPTQTFADPKTSAGVVERAGAASADIKILSDRSDLRLSATANQLELENNARKFLDDNAEPLGLDDTGSELKLKATKRSPSGTYLSYEQTIDDIPILDSQIAVSIGKGGNVRSVVRNVVRVPLAKMNSIARSSRISEQQAYEIAWQDLGAHGDLLEAPSISTAYLNENNALTLVYVVRVAVEQPLGYWEYRVDANTGRIVQRFDRRVEQSHPRKTTGDDEPVGGAARIAPRAAEGSFADALARFNAKPQAARAVTPLAAAKSVDASGVVFDPNPLTSLDNFGLKDASGAQKFNRAYVKVTLSNVTESNGRLYLSGPNVRIEDFEPGDGNRNRAPSSVTKEWTAHRGNNAFNDVMTYYFLDKSLTYLRSLGYNGQYELFPNGIAADLDGLNGDDNSHFVPDSDRLAFGHGCVDDNEDTDVIMHEFGHAIHFHINPDWYGGDSGAIGEGFGDYWAYSYRKKLDSWQRGDVGKVYVWDGVASCWPGRRVDNSRGRFKPGSSYEAHQDVGGFQADELWSTPLVQSLNELVKLGQTPELVDLVVLEGMFGIGSNFSMRSLAQATVNKAKELYPDGPHATVFEKNFRKNNVLR